MSVLSFFYRDEHIHKRNHEKNNNPSPFLRNNLLGNLSPCLIPFRPEVGYFIIQPYHPAKRYCIRLSVRLFDEVDRENEKVMTKDGIFRFVE